jgi:chromosome segregation ATPase
MLQNKCQAVSQRLTKVNADLRDTEQGKKDAEQGKASAEEAINALKYRESRLKEESAAMRAQCGMLKTQLEEERGKRRRLESDTISGVHPLHVGEEGVR